MLGEEIEVPFTRVLVAADEVLVRLFPREGPIRDANLDLLDPTPQRLEDLEALVPGEDLVVGVDDGQLYDSTQP